MTVLCIIPGPTEVVGEERQEPIWCFGCRKRLPGTHVLLTDPFPSYYDPVWAYRCDGCRHDRRLGFGRGWCDE